MTHQQPLPFSFKNIMVCEKIFVCMLRPHFLRVGLNGQAPGSAYYEQGLTKVVATVYGPRENTFAEGETVSSGVLEVRVQFAPFSSPARRGAQAGVLMEAERRLEASLHQALLPSLLLERFPKSVVEVHLLVLEEDGGVLAAGATAASAALVDAGVDVVDAVVAAHVGQQGGGGALVDPSALAASSCAGATTVAYMPNLQRVTLAQHSGAVEAPRMLQGLTLALDACVALHSALRATLLEAAAARRPALAQ